MNELINTNRKINTINSLKVAEMIEERHSNLIRRLEKIHNVLENSKMSSQDFMIESTYKTEGNNKSYKCYELTRKGCEMIANKLTGEKGILFTAKYIELFHKMENELKKVDSYMIQDPIERAKAWIKEEEERKRLREENTKLIPKAEFYDLVANTDDWSSMKEVANILNRGIGSNTLFRILRDKKILITGGSNHNYPYQQYINRGYFKVIETNKVVRGEIKKKTVVSQKGIKFINKVLDEV